jgi:mRNA interferase MazF
MAYIPKQGDIIYIEFNPQASHEQKGKRPALVVSNFTYNRFTKLAMVCPITNTNREFDMR